MKAEIIYENDTLQSTLVTIDPQDVWNACDTIAVVALPLKFVCAAVKVIVWLAGFGAPATSNVITLLLAPRFNALAVAPSSTL